ncbi:class I SAM-dependent methyltransferase [Streptomyces montanus]|uniref:class I SAM-dependent methyltransferase n=1 Tax=Streptomyces montanus TaxID=2580423 RepID=UPI001FE85B10|nr:class I SAM-dependent methyltransferase [Streptomyces montanus]
MQLPLQEAREGHEGYVFDNANTQAVEQHRCLAASLDPITTSRLAATGVRAGWNCLEVGAGGGSVARWLADRVAPAGEVVATDINPDHLRARPGLRVLRHDVVRDPLPEEAFDLVHARLVLLHLPEREAVLAKLVRALRPGGLLQLDEFDIDYGPVLLAPSRGAAELYERFLAAKARMFADAGADGSWGRHAAAAMRAAGLADIDPVPYLVPWRAGSPGVDLLIHHTHHLRDRFIAAGLTDAELADVREVMRHPDFRASSCAIYSVQGRRPR